MYWSYQVDDKQLRLDQTLDYQQRYQEALLNISDWLDDIELRLFDGKFQHNTEQHLINNEVIYIYIYSYIYYRGNSSLNIIK